MNYYRIIHPATGKVVNLYSLNSSSAVKNGEKLLLYSWLDNDDQKWGMESKNGKILLRLKRDTNKVMHWEHFFKHIWQKYNSIYREQLPLITPHVCRHTYCSNMAKSGMNPKTLQYLMGHSDIGVTLNTYTHLGYEDAKDELQRLVKAG